MDSRAVFCGLKPMANRSSVRNVIFDVGNVLYGWHPRFLFEKIIDDPAELEHFLGHVVTLEWHFQHDAGRDFADTSRELIAQFPQYRAHIEQYGRRFGESISGPVPGSLELLRELDEAGVPLFAITNFSHELFPPFRAQHAEIFDRFRDIVVSGEERLVKPDPAIYALAMRRFGITADSALFIDDNHANIVAAGEFGLHVHHFADAKELRRELVSLNLMP